MSYYFANKAEGKVEITDEQNNTYTLKQINSTSNQATAADSIMGGLSTMLDIVGWQVNDVVRVVNQDVLEGEDPSGSKQVATIAFSNAETIYPDQGGVPTIAGDISYNGDGTLYNLTGNSISSIPNGYHLTYTMSGSHAAYIIFAEETSNYSAAVFTY